MIRKCILLGLLLCAATATAAPSGGGAGVGRNQTLAALPKANSIAELVARGASTQQTSVQMRANSLCQHAVRHRRRRTVWHRWCGTTLTTSQRSGGSGLISLEHRAYARCDDAALPIRPVGRL